MQVSCWLSSGCWRSIGSERISSVRWHWYLRQAVDSAPEGLLDTGNGPAGSCQRTAGQSSVRNRCCRHLWRSREKSFFRDLFLIRPIAQQGLLTAYRAGSHGNYAQLTGNCGDAGSRCLAGMPQSASRQISADTSS